MSRRRFGLLAALIVLLWVCSETAGSTRPVMAQGPSLEEVTRAVVRIAGQRCEPVCREAGVGSGALIHPSGVILTAYHALLDPEKSPAQYLDDYVIEMSEDVRRPAVARYRARVIAVQPELDLALLRIDRTADGSQAFGPFDLDGLPVLPLGSAAGLRLQEQLLIAGYPYLGGRSIKVDSKNLTGFDSQRVSGLEVPGAFLTVQGRLSEGYSGGPALAARDGAYQIVGTVIKGVGVGQEIGYLRSIDLLRDLQWLETGARARAESVQLELSQTAGGEQELRISLDVDALDLAGRQARLVFYAYADDVLALPVYVAAGPNRTRVGQLAFATDLEARQFVDRIAATWLRLPVGAAAIAAAPMKFRALLWDDEVLWQSNEWYRPQVREVAETAAPALAEAPTTTEAPPTMTPTPALAASATRVSEKDGMVMVYVPAGEFLMGSTDSDPGAESDEKPQHAVYLDAFWIDQTEVTEAQYQQCVEAEACLASTFPGTGQGDHPVVFVSWEDAARYCAWAQRRLPTEAEWEKAARGTDGRIYPWGNDAPDCIRARHVGCMGSMTAVGSYPSGASPYGVLDMAGGVWEWVADWYDKTYYSGAAMQNPKGPDSGQSRVMRGGSWYFVESDIRAPLRGRYAPDVGGGDVGFRCARSP